MDLETLYKTYYGKLYAYCLTLAKNRTRAEDLTEETFFRAIKKAGSFRGESDLGVWLCSIARNLFLDEERKKKRVQKCDPPPDLYGSLEDSDDAKRILIAMNALEEPYRGVFCLKVIGKMSGADIGKVYKKSENWVYVIYYRAKLKILEIMEENCE